MRQPGSTPLGRCFAPPPHPLALGKHADGSARRQLGESGAQGPEWSPGARHGDGTKKVGEAIEEA